MRKYKTKFILCSFILVLLINLASAAEFNHVISNSDNWRDVYSIIHFATLNKVDSDFLVSTKHGPLLINGLAKTSDYMVISSKKRAYVPNYADMMKASGFNNVEEINVDNANIDLIEQLKEINNFVIVSNDYGYYAVSAAPYAVVKNSWVFFADRNNIDEIDNVLANRNVGEVLIYGKVDNEVSDTLNKYNPKVIDAGDRFKDNTQIVDLYLKEKPTKQIILTNGEFIEKEIMSGIEPILFTGKENVPDQIRDYLISSDIEVGVLIGSDLVGAATNIRRSTGISVIAKFARGARQFTGAISTVEGLDLFYLPVPVVALSLHSARYNKASNQLEITYKSDSNIPIYFKGTITYTNDKGESTRVGDASASFISPNDYKTVIYDDVIIREDNMSVDVFTLYGDASASLDKILEASINVEMVDIIDKCDIDVLALKYNDKKNEFGVVIKNLVDNVCYADVELIGVIVDGEETDIGVSGATMLNPNKKVKVKIPFELTEKDIADNEYVNVNVYFGEKEDSLTKLTKAKLKLELEGLLYIIIIIIIIIVLLGLFVFFLLLWRKRRKDDDIY